jgi:hypothetical protein
MSLLEENTAPELHLTQNTSILPIRWQRRQPLVGNTAECAEEEQRQLSTRLIEQHSLNKQTIEVRVKGKISEEDFATRKAAIAAEVAAIEQGLKRLEDERTGMQELIKNTEVRLRPC